MSGKTIKPSPFKVRKSHANPNVGVISCLELHNSTYTTAKCSETHNIVDKTKNLPFIDDIFISTTKAVEPTLIDDTQKLLNQNPEKVASDAMVENPWASIDDKADPTVPTATLQIYQFIEENLQRAPSPDVNRASAATGCAKKRQFQRMGAKAKPMAPRALINFALGDLTEKMLLYFIKAGLVGPGKMYSEVDFGKSIGEFTIQGKKIEVYDQQHLVTKIPGFSPDITAHADGWGKRNADGKWELIEIKSAADWGFNEFKTQGPGDYLKQAHVLMKTDKAIALGVSDVRFFYIKKQTGHAWDRLHSFNPVIWREVVAEYKAAASDEPMAAPFQLKRETSRGKATGRTIAAFPCSYCPFLEACHGPHSVQWKSDQFGHQKPVYVFEGAT